MSDRLAESWSVVLGDEDDVRGVRQAAKKAAISIRTYNLKWANLARYLELEFKGVQFPKASDPVWMLPLLPNAMLRANGGLTRLACAGVGQGASS